MQRRISDHKPQTVMGPSRIRVMIVDDHEVVRNGIAAILAPHSDVIVVAEASNGPEAIRMFRTHRPDVTLLGDPRRVPGEPFHRPDRPYGRR